VTDNQLSYCITNPTFGQNIRKRLLMMILYFGLDEHVNLWTRKTGIVLHKWSLRQVYVDGDWIGSFSLDLTQSGVIMRIAGDETSCKIFINKTNEMETTYKLLEKGSELLQKDIKTLTDQTTNEHGNYTIVNNKVVPTVRGSGFEIRVIRLPNLTFHDNDIIVKDEVTTLFDQWGDKIYNIKTGLLRTSSVNKIPKELDIRIHGISFNKILEMGCFKEDWDIRMYSKKRLITMFNNLKVDPPEVTQVTKERLALDSDIKTHVERELDEVEVDVAYNDIENADDPLDFFLNASF
jgi:hypothetical protein